MRNSPMVSCRRSGLLLVLVATSTIAVSADNQTHVTTVEQWTTAFADEEVQLTVRVDAKAAPSGKILWSHSANRRTITSGEVPLQPDGEFAATAKVMLRCPPLRDNIVLATSVSAEFVPEGQKSAVASFERTLTLFPTDPFSGRHEWTKQLDIELFDPEGKTATVFASMKLPHRQVHNPAALDHRPQAGILIVGEGTSMIKNRVVAEALWKAAAAGRRVILLAPSEGSLPWPEAGNGIDGGLPIDMRFARSQIISELDKRLDATAWRHTGHSVPAIGLNLESDRRQILLTVSENAASWPWVTARYPEGKGVLVMCGFRIIEHWDDGPTPRYLFLKILESLEHRND